MAAQPDFEELLRSIAKQHQQKSDLEVGLRQAETKRKNLESELVGLQEKNVRLKHLIPDLRAGISSKLSEKSNKSDQLAVEKATVISMEKSAEAAKIKVGKRREALKHDELEEVALVQDTRVKLSDVEFQLTELHNLLGFEN